MNTTRARLGYASRDVGQSWLTWLVLGFLAGAALFFWTTTRTSAAAALPPSGGFALRAADVEARLSPDYWRCVERAQGTGQMRRCSAAEQQRLTPLMEAAFGNAVGRMSDPAARERLRADQAGWQQGRQSRCRRDLRESDEQGDSMGLLMLDRCRLDELARRNIWLELHR
jgi:hypothetical protein